MTYLDETLAISKEITDSIVPLLVAMFGVPCEIYYPISNPSIYGTEDNIISYNATPDLRGEYLVIGDFFGRKRFRGDITPDLYTSEENYMIVREKDVIEQDSKVIVKYRTMLYSYRVSVINVTLTRDRTMFKKIPLVPMEVMSQ